MLLSHQLKMPLFSAFCTVNHFSPFGRILATSEIPQPLSHQTKTNHTTIHFWRFKTSATTKTETKNNPPNNEQRLQLPKETHGSKLPRPMSGVPWPHRNVTGVTSRSVKRWVRFSPRGGEVTFTFPNALRHGLLSGGADKRPDRDGKFYDSNNNNNNNNSFFVFVVVLHGETYFPDMFFLCLCFS